MGYCGKADTTKEETSKVAALEKVQIAVMGSYETDGKINIDQLNENLKKIHGLTYQGNQITDTNKIENLDEDRTVVVDGYEVTIHKEGKNVTIGNTIVEPPKEKPKTDGSWNGTVNTPNLINNTMQAVYWVANEGEDKEQHPQKEIIGDTGENWYNYVEGDNNTDTKTSHWANAKTEDGSYWVWIPRYEYKILSGEGTSTAGKIVIKFIPTEQTKADDGYKIHPAFQDGKANNYKRGEWDSELPGIWVAKYEISMETDGVHTETSSAEIGDVLTKNAGNTADIRVVSKPNVSSWRNITIGNSYTNSYNYDRTKESHLMKNSEWGAVAYLTHSQYGRNGHEIDINNSSSFMTGNGGGSTFATEVAGITNAYDSNTGVRASTTGNIYGIYDLSGGAWERVAAYITNGNTHLSTGDSFIKQSTKNVEAYKTLSNKYATIYPFNSSSDKGIDNYKEYKKIAYGYGDALLETAISRK